MGSNLARRVAQQTGAAAQQAPGQEQPRSIGSLIQSMRPEIARALPKHMDADRLARIALTVLRRNPDLARSTPESFMGALLSAAQLGLEPGVSQEAYLVPYEHRRGPQAGTVECQLIIGYQGYAKLFWQHPLAKHLDAQAVYEADEFDYAYGLEPFLRHKPALTGRTGNPIAYYAVAALTSGGSAFVVLSPDEVKALRGGKVGPSGNIADPMHWMERKTAVRQLVHLLPKSADLIRALDADESIRTDLHEDAIDAPAHHPVIEQTAPQTPPAGGGAVTEQQLADLTGVLQAAGLEDAHDAKSTVVEIVGRDVDAFADLTADEAQTVIDTLTAVTARS